MKAVIAVMAFLATVSALTEHNTVFFTRSNIPKGWSKGPVAPKHAPVRFTLALQQRNLDALESLFWSVSTPGSPNYQKFMTTEAIQSIVAPEQSVREEVFHWLRSAGIQRWRDYKDAVEVVTTVERAAKLFNTHFHVFSEDETGRKQIKSFGTAEMPVHIKRHIQFVDGLSTFPVPHLKVKVRGHDSSPVPNDSFGVIPQSMYGLYQVPVETDGSAPQTSVGVIEFQGESYAPADLAAYAQACNIQITPIAANNTVGPNDPTSPQIEAELDIEFAATVNPAAVSWFWLEDGQGWLFQFVNHYFNTPIDQTPQVVSISYAWSEMDQCEIDPDNCQSGSTDYVNRCNVVWQEIALRGNSILVASGDSGANGRTDPDCSIPYLKPDYPACSPYVTSVGATEIQQPTLLSTQPSACTQASVQCIKDAGTTGEQAVSYDFSQFASGGGFSTISPTPSYQAADVKGYLASKSITFPPASYFNATNRGFPDIAAVGHDCLIYDAGSWMPVGGTSCAAPIVAAIMSIVNQAALKKTGKPLGFLNPFLYKMHADCPQCFHDITVGDNLCTEGGCSASCEGFYATTGWDPVTGLGTPNTQNIINYVNSHL